MPLRPTGLSPRSSAKFTGFLHVRDAHDALVQGPNPFRHDKIPANRRVSGAAETRNERFSTIFSTGVENFGRKPQPAGSFQVPGARGQTADCSTGRQRSATSGASRPRRAIDRRKRGSLPFEVPSQAALRTGHGNWARRSRGAARLSVTLDEANVSAQQPPASPNPRVPGADANQERPDRAQAAAGQGPQAAERLHEVGGPVPAVCPQASQRFRGAQRIRRRAEYQAVYDGGRKLSSRTMTVFTLPRPGRTTRLGIAATRKLGGAVERNRAKRLIRELFRRNPAPSGYDIVVVPRRTLFDATYLSLEAEYVATVARLRPGARRS